MSDSDTSYGSYFDPTGEDPYRASRLYTGEGAWQDVPARLGTPGNAATAFDPSQVSYTARPNYQGIATEYYDANGNMIGYLGKENAPVSTSGLNFIDAQGKPTAARDRSANIQATDANGNLLYLDNEGNVTTQVTDRPHSAGVLAGLSNARMYEPQNQSLFADPLFRNFMLSAGAMAGAAALAPSMAAGAGAEAGAGAGALGSGWEGSAAAMEAIGQGSAPLTASEMAALSGSTGLPLSTVAQYAQYGMKGLGALQSLAGMVGGQGGQGSSQGGYGGQTMVVNPNGPWNTFLKPGLETVGPTSQRPIVSGLENLEMLSPDVQPNIPQQSYFTYGSPAQTTYSTVAQGYKRGGALKSQDMGEQEHVPEFITGATGHYVKGRGDGQSDDIPAMLADGEYVFDADTVAALGNGSSDAGAKVLDKMREELRAHKRSAPVDEIPPKAKSPLEYIKQGMKRK